MHFKTAYIFFILFFYIFDLNSSIFDSVNWDFDKKNNNISLYVKKDIINNINFYKAEAYIKNIDYNIISYNILDCNKYKKIFINVEEFKIIKHIDNTRFLLLAELNFFPYQNRTYFTECNLLCNSEVNNLGFELEWYPYKSEENTDFVNKKAKFVKNIFGRWKVKNIDNETYYISLEYYNNWETNLPPKLVYEFEKYYTVKNLLTMINYSKKETKKMNK